jgi:hypothetical protein
MRQYVPQRDTILRRRAENISAVIGALRNDPTRWEQLRELVRALPEQQVAEVDVESSQLDDGALHRLLDLPGGADRQGAVGRS